MTEVSFEKARHLPLPYIKTLSAELLILNRRGEASDADDPAPVNAALDEAARSLARQDAALEGEPLTAFLDRLDACLERELRFAAERARQERGAAAPDPQDILTRQGADRGRFDCDACGGRGAAICEGWAGEEDNITRPGGGLCLDFVRAMAARFAELADREYRSLAAFVVDGAGPVVDRIGIDNRPASGGARDATLPIDAEFRYPGAEAPARIILFWPPAEQGLDRALLVLPYLMFHEVFVHGAQMALAARREKVPENCPFTEGTVDAVAADTLLRLLYLPDTLPDLMGPMHLEVRGETLTLVEARKRPERRQAAEALVGAGPKRKRIAAARARGHRGFAFLKTLEAAGGYDGSWAERLVMALNLCASRAERPAIHYALFRAREQGLASEDLKLLAGRFDDFFRTRDLGAILRFVDALTRSPNR